MDGTQEAHQSQPAAGTHRAITKTYSSTYISESPQLQPLIDLLESKSSNDNLAATFESAPSAHLGENREIDYSTIGPRYESPYDASTSVAAAATMVPAVYNNPQNYCIEPMQPMGMMPEHYQYNWAGYGQFWQMPSTPRSSEKTDDTDSDDDDEQTSLTHPNKYPVEIECHWNKQCSYKRQNQRSGEKLKKYVNTTNDPMTLQQRNDVQIKKCYHKHLVRICRCGKYNDLEPVMQHGRNNDCCGYEIHYSQKCRWKAYDDYKTNLRVLIRLCKCYKPS